MITTADMIDHLMTMDRLNLGTVKAGQAELWAEVLNSALPDVTSSQVRQAIVKLAGTRSSETRGVFLTPSDLIDAVTEVSAAEKRLRQARLEQAKHEHGDFTIHPSVTDPAEFLRFKQTAQAAFHEGATVEQAQAAGFAAIGRPVPAPEITTKQDTTQFTTIGRKIA